MSFAFLPLQRMAEMAPDAAERFRTAQPYPHVVLDGLFDPDLLHGIVAEFPRPDEVAWQTFRNRREVKLAASRDEFFKPLTKALLYHLNSAPFLEFLTKVTGIENLVADSFFEGGGMHQIERGGRLSVHADFNYHPGTRLDRRLNALLYLNTDWEAEYGGNLELWNRDMTACVTKVPPLFNRLVIFATTDTAYHGHPDPLNCPHDRTRKSLALYYYTNGRPQHETSDARTTLFKARPNENLNETLKVGPRSGKELMKDLLPPMVTRFISRHTGKPK